jgi:hypothetical protein
MGSHDHAGRALEALKAGRHSDLKLSNFQGLNELTIPCSKLQGIFDRKDC